jgi:hypothetical protein
VISAARRTCKETAIVVVKWRYRKLARPVSKWVSFASCAEGRTHAPFHVANVSPETEVLSAVDELLAAARHGRSQFLVVKRGIDPVQGGIDAVRTRLDPGAERALSATGRRCTGNWDSPALAEFASANRKCGDGLESYLWNFQR